MEQQQDKLLQESIHMQCKNSNIEFPQDSHHRQGKISKIPHGIVKARSCNMQTICKRKRILQGVWHAMQKYRIKAEEKGFTQGTSLVKKKNRITQGVNDMQCKIAESHFLTDRAEWCLQTRRERFYGLKYIQCKNRKGIILRGISNIQCKEPGFSNL